MQYVHQAHESRVRLSQTPAQLAMACAQRMRCALIWRWFRAEIQNVNINIEFDSIFEHVHNKRLLGLTR